MPAIFESRQGVNHVINSEFLEKIQEDFETTKLKQL